MEERAAIMVYLNVDMVASPNAGYFTYDGDQSEALDRGQAAPRVPEGSAGIERMLVAYLMARMPAIGATYVIGQSCVIQGSLYFELCG